MGQREGGEKKKTALAICCTTRALNNLAGMHAMSLEEAAFPELLMMVWQKGEVTTETLRRRRRAGTASRVIIKR